MLRRSGTASIPPISLVLLSETSRYIDGLTAYRGDDVAAWVEYFCDVVERATQRSAVLGARLTQIQSVWLDMAGRPRADASVRRVIALIPYQPILDAAAVAQALGVSDVAARNALNTLDAAGVLSQVHLAQTRVAHQGSSRIASRSEPMAARCSASVGAIGR